MEYKIICAGFGGQGVLTAGKILIYVAHQEGKKITWFPSYGNEMRGGSANCNVVISDEKIASPYVNRPNMAILMNGPSVEKYENLIEDGGLAFVNSSLLDKDRKYREDIRVINIPVTDFAQELNNERVANICMLGSFIKQTNMFEKEVFIKHLCNYFDEQGKGKHNKSNVAAFEKGYNYL